MEILLSISIAMTAGLFVSRLAKIFKLPAVTGYLIAGILVGPYVLGQLGIEGLGFTSHNSVQELGLLSDVALGFIAFAIGNEFRLSQLKKTGKQATVIGIFQAVIATLCVDGALIGLYFLIGGKLTELTIPVALTLGAIASATAPAATLMVVRQYKAEGKLTDLLLPIVALDDAVGLIIFAVSFGIAGAIKNGQADIISIIVNPLLEIIFSLILGSLMGVLFSLAEKYFKSNSKRLALAVTTVILTVALSMLKFEVSFNFGTVHIGFSSLLVCMMLGTVFCNMCDFSAEIMDKTDKWTAPLFIIFFVLSGAELELSVFTNLTIIIIGVVYIIARSLGKYYGARVSAGFVGCDDNIKKYLGITLLPQAGVALGMSAIVASKWGVGEGATIRNIVLFGVLIYELFGPMLTKIALTKAGDIHPKANSPIVVEDDSEDEE